MEEAHRYQVLRTKEDGAIQPPSAASSDHDYQLWESFKTVQHHVLDKETDLWMDQPNST